MPITLFVLRFYGPVNPMGSCRARCVYADNRHNDIHYHLLPEIHFTASGFFLKTFDRLCIFVFVSFRSSYFLFFYKPVKQTHFYVEVFQIIT